MESPKLFTIVQMFQHNTGADMYTGDSEISFILH